MVSFNKVNQFVEDLGKKVHDLNGNALKVALSNTAPDASTMAVLADITELGAGSGYSAGGTAPATHSYAQVAGVGKLAADDVVFTASGGTIGPFRYAWLYNSTPSSPLKPLIGWWNYGSSITLNDGETFTVNITDNTQAITIQ